MGELFIKINLRNVESERNSKEMNYISFKKASKISMLFCYILSHPEIKGMMGLFFTYALQSFLLKNNFAEKARQEDILQKSNIDWIAIRPSLLTNGPRTGKYKAGFAVGEKINPKISRADIADFIVKNVSTTKYSKTAVNLSY